MTAIEYQAYLQTPRWKELVRQTRILQRCCQRCGISHQDAKRYYGQELNVHHMSYRNLWTAEEENDLCALCRWCHAKHHDKPLPGRFYGDVHRAIHGQLKYWTPAWPPVRGERLALPGAVEMLPLLEQEAAKRRAETQGRPDKLSQKVDSVSNRNESKDACWVLRPSSLQLAAIDRKTLISRISHATKGFTQ